MENISGSKNEIASQTIVGVPVKAITVVVAAAETLGPDVQKVVVEGATGVAITTRVVAGDVTVAGRELEHDAKSVVSSEPGPGTPPASPIAEPPVA